MKGLKYAAALAALAATAGEAILLWLTGSNATAASYATGQESAGHTGAADFFAFMAFLGAAVCGGLWLGTAALWSEEL